MSNYENATEIYVSFPIASIIILITCLFMVALAAWNEQVL